MKHITSPSAGDLQVGDTAVNYVSEVYSEMLKEIVDAEYSDAELALMRDSVMYYGRYLQAHTRYYFEKTVIPPIADAVAFFAAKSPGTVLDLGCGLGMQSIIFASMGFKVVAVDLRPNCIELCKKRKAYYEERFGRVLDIDFICENFSELNSSSRAASIDAVFSMSAFSYIQPLEDTVAKISELCRPDARIFLFEENIDHFYASTVRRRNVPRPSIVREALEKEGFAGGPASGTCAVPKQAWTISFLRPLIISLDRLLRKFNLLAFSYKLAMERTSR